eukprot:1283863-Prymnesium_polylepis.1
MLRVTPPHTRRYKLSSHPRARTLRTKHGRRFPRAASPMDAHLDVPAPHAPAPSHVHRRLAARIHDPPAVRNVGEAVPEHGAELRASRTARDQGRAIVSGRARACARALAARHARRS